MHQTTIRFSHDLWSALDEEAARLGVSAAQYIREATVARLAYGVGRRGDRDFEQAVRAAGADRPETEWDAEGAARHARQESAVEQSREVVSSSEALWAQGKLARERSQQLREATISLRNRR
jgi:hypothetical protein